LRDLVDTLLADGYLVLGTDGLASHHLILGQRGMGKTSILRRLAIGVRDDPALSAVLLPLSFREEQYNVHSLHVFWCNCLDALGDWFERSGQPDKAAAVDRDAPLLSGAKPDPEGDAALDVFRRWARQEGRRPLLLVQTLLNTDPGRIRTLYDLTGGNPRTLTLLYLLLYLLGRTDEAADAYQQALMIDPANLSTPSHLLTARLIQPAYQDDQELDFDVIVGRRPGAGADLLRAIRAIAQDNFGTAQESFAAALSSEQTINFLINRGRVVLFLRQAAQSGYGDRLLTALTERGLADCHWPLQAAFDAYLYGEARLKDVNPEVRGAARRIYDWLDAPRRQGRVAQ